jgi:hypothetical protein
MQTERVTYLTNAEQKAALEAFAKARGESVGSVLREAAARYIATPDSDDDNEAFEALVQELQEAVPRWNAKLDRMFATIDRTNATVDAALARVEATK